MFVNKFHVICPAILESPFLYMKARRLIHYLMTVYQMSIYCQALYYMLDKKNREPNRVCSSYYKELTRVGETNVKT